jgi:hypothetical protein
MELETEERALALENTTDIAQTILEDAGADTLGTVELRDYEQWIDRKRAKILLRELAYYYMYISTADRGMPYTDKGAHELIKNEYAWLVEISGWKYKQIADTRRHGEARAKLEWDRQFDNRKIYAHQRFAETMIEIERMKPGLVNAILEGDIDAVSEYVQLTRLEMDAAGYRAPAKYEFSAREGDDLSEADKAAIAAGVDMAGKFDQELLGDGEIVEGDFTEDE